MFGVYACGFCDLNVICENLRLITLRFRLEVCEKESSIFFPRRCSGGLRAGHLSVQHFTLHQPRQGRQGLSFVAEGAAAHDSVRLHISVWGISPPPRRGSTDGSKQRLQGFCSTAVAFLPPTERSDRGNTAVGHRTRVLQPKGDGGLRPILDLRRFNFPSTKGSSRC